MGARSIGRCRLRSEGRRELAHIGPQRHLIQPGRSSNALPSIRTRSSWLNPAILGAAPSPSHVLSWFRRIARSSVQTTIANSRRATPANLKPDRSLREIAACSTISSEGTPPKLCTRFPDTRTANSGSHAKPAGSIAIHRPTYRSGPENNRMAATCFSTMQISYHSSTPKGSSNARNTTTPGECHGNAKEPITAAAPMRTTPEPTQRSRAARQLQTPPLCAQTHTGP